MRFVIHTVTDVVIEQDANTNIRSGQTYISICMLIYTITIVVLKHDVYTVDAVHSTKIHLPPHCRVWAVDTYFLCPHTRRYVSVHCVFCSVPCSRERVGLRGVLLIWQIIFKRRIYRHIYLFSSLELKARVSFSDHFLSVVCPSVCL